jgi:SAM-dependent methyltransferase
VSRRLSSAKGYKMSDVWYNQIALRNGGYLNKAKYKKIGFSGEDVFEQTLFELIKPTFIVLDAGCGHGDFTLRTAKLVKHIYGFDYSSALIRIAEENKKHSGILNIDFIFATTKAKLPFRDNQFDLVFSRRGPTSIIEHTYLLKDNSIIIGIHSAGKDTVIERLQKSGLRNIEIIEFPNSFLIFDNKNEYAEYLSSFPGNPDFLLPENRTELEKNIIENTVDGIIKVQEWRYIWKAIK